MSKHTNKHWLREKEFISLKMEYDFLRNITVRSHRYRSLDDSVESTRIQEVIRSLNNKFHNEYNGGKAPRWYRNMLNRKQRAKSKLILYKTINIEGDYIFDDNFKDAAWSYF